MILILRSGKYLRLLIKRNAVNHKKLRTTEINIDQLMDVWTWGDLRGEVGRGEG